MIRKSFIKIISATILFLLMVTVAALAATVGNKTKYAEAISMYDLTFIGPNGYYTKEQGYKLAVYVPKALYETDEFTITYQRVQLNSVADATSPGLSTYNGKFVDSTLKVLDDNVEVTEDMMVNGLDASEKYKVFFCETNVNCAWCFTVKYTIDKSGENASETANFHTAYCVNIDDSAPKMFDKTAIISGENQVRVTKNLYDNYEVKGSAISGILNIRLFRHVNGTQETADEVIDEKTFPTPVSSYEYIYTVDKGMYNYYLIIADKVGNTTGKLIFASFSDAAYNEILESKVDYALSDLSRFTTSIQHNLTTAYNDYMIITRDDNSTVEQKDNATERLQEAYDAYEEAKTDYENGILCLTVDITDKDVANNLTVNDMFRSLGFLKVGDEVTITITPSKSAYSDSNGKKSLLQKTDMKKATDMYSFTIRTYSTDVFEIRKAFSYPMIMKMNLGTYKNYSAVQQVYDTDGKENVYICNIVEYADGTISVEAPYTSGTVYVFCDSGKNKNLYWLLLLGILPLSAGVILLVYSYNKIKKKKTDDKTDDKNIEQAEKNKNKEK